MLELTQRQSCVLAALAAEKGSSFAPVQVQKLFFLIDKNVGGRIGGPQFNFQPYDYGPFDSAVYRELEALEHQGYVSILNAGSPRRNYALTAAGETAGSSVLTGLPGDVSDYIGRVAHWVRSLSFAQLVGSIYQQYPEMRANSIFQD